MTLVELMTAMAIASIVGAVILRILFVTMDVYTAQQIENEQYIIVDAIESRIREEVSYAYEVIISDEATGSSYSTSQYHTLESIDSTLVKNGTEIFMGESQFLDHSVRVTFKADIETNEDEKSYTNLFVNIYIDEMTEYELIESFNFKVLNLSLDEDGEVVEDAGASGAKIFYKYSN